MILILVRAQIITGSQVIAASFRQVFGLEGMLARVGLVYGLASFVCPQIIAISTEYLG